jgi:CRP/FNR family transcriptional regulator, cyclic AMP receptor protein
MTSEQHRNGSTIFAKGDRADKLYFIEQGRILFPELGRGLSTGGFFGEVGLFAPQGVRSASAVCEGDCRLCAITRDKVLELYYQDPGFGFFLIRMVSALVQEDGHSR